MMRPDQPRRPVGPSLPDGHDLKGPRASKRAVVGSSLVILAGALAFTGAVIGWESVSSSLAGGGMHTVLVGNRSIGFWVGPLMLLYGAILIGLREPAEFRKTRAAPFVPAGILALYVAWDLIGERARLFAATATKLSADLHLPLARPRDLIDRELADGTLRFSLRPGIFLAMTAAALSVTGGMILLRQGRPRSGDATGRTSTGTSGIQLPEA